MQRPTSIIALCLKKRNVAPKYAQEASRMKGMTSADQHGLYVIDWSRKGPQQCFCCVLPALQLSVGKLASQGIVQGTGKADGKWPPVASDCHGQ